MQLLIIQITELKRRSKIISKISKNIKILSARSPLKFQKNILLFSISIISLKSNSFTKKFEKFNSFTKKFDFNIAHTNQLYEYFIKQIKIKLKKITQM